MKNLLLVALSFLLGFAHSATGQTVRSVRLTTVDDVGIAAAYYPVDGKSVPAVVLIHSFARNRDEWNAFAVLLQRNGIAALTFDLRWHGESTRRVTAAGPQLVDQRNFTPRDFNDMLLDVNTAVYWLGSQQGINPRRIAVVGSSVGANIALRYALFNEDLAALMLISPGIVYKGLRTDDAMGKLGPLPLRMVVSRNDAFAFESVKRLEAIRQEIGHQADTNELIVCTGNLHGTDMLKGVKDLTPTLLNWLRHVLLGVPLEQIEPAAPPPASPPASAPQPPAAKTPTKPAR